LQAYYTPAAETAASQPVPASESGKAAATAANESAAANASPVKPK
jgi:hypothetical protein